MLTQLNTSQLTLQNFQTKTPGKQAKNNNREGNLTYSIYNTKGSSAVSFGCLYCALIHVAKESDTGKKLFDSILGQPTEAVAGLKPDAFFAELKDSAKCETPPIPFDAGTSTHFITPHQIYKEDQDKNKALALVAAMIDRAPERLKDAYIDALNTPNSDLFNPDSRGVWFLASYDIGSGHDDHAHSHDHDHDHAEHSHSVSQKDRDNFTNAQAFPYAVALTKYSDQNELLIGDIKEGIGMQGSNARVSAIERLVASAINAELQHSNRPEKFQIRIPNHLLKTIPEPVVAMLTREPVDAKKVDAIIKEQLIAINNKLSGEQNASESKSLKDLRADNKQLVKLTKLFEKEYSDNIANLYLQAKVELSQQRGIGFRKVSGKDGDNLLLEVDLSNTERINNILKNIQSDITNSRVTNKNNGLDPAFNEPGKI